jgi:hypothetical protein
VKGPDIVVRSSMATRAVSDLIMEGIESRPGFSIDEITATL